MEYTEKQFIELEQERDELKADVKRLTQELKEAQTDLEISEANEEKLQREMGMMSEEVGDTESATKVLKIFADHHNWQGNCFIPSDVTVLATYTFPDALAQAALEGKA